MKKTLTLSAVLLFAAFVSNGQKAITLTQDNIDVDPGTVKQTVAASVSGVKAPATGANKTWDYSKVKSGSVSSTKYYANKTYKAFSKSAVYSTGFLAPFDSTPGDIYVTNPVYDENKNGYFFAGDYTPRFPSDLSPATGEPGDSLNILTQASLPTKTDYIIKFPATYNDSWSAKYTKTINFVLTVAFLEGYDGQSYSNMACTEVEYTTVTNTVVGYGDVRTPNMKDSRYYHDNDGLLIRRSVLTIDSIFFGGVPAPPEICALFDVSQGMPTVISYTESIYTAGDWIPAMTFDFGTDKNYSKLAGINFRNDDGDTKCGSVAVDEAAAKNGNTAQYGNTLFNATPGSNDNLAVTNFTTYPNPVANGAAVSCRFTKNVEGTWNLNVCNAVGQVVKIIPVSGTGNMLVSVPMENNANGGFYFINLLNESGQQAASAKFMVGAKN